MYILTDLDLKLVGVSELTLFSCFTCVGSVSCQCCWPCPMIDPDYHKLSFNWPSFVPAVLSCWNAPMAVWVWNLPYPILLLYKTDLKINIISKVYDCKIFYPFLFYYHLLSFPCEQFMILGFIFIYLLLVSFFYKKVAVVGACLAEIFIYNFTWNVLFLLYSGQEITLKNHTCSIPLLLMTWRGKGPGHQQQWYWSSSSRIFQLKHQEVLGWYWSVHLQSCAVIFF